MANGKTTYFYKLFRVKRNDGRVTTVSLDPALVAEACREIGDVKKVGQLVREAALVYNDDSVEAPNCSRYVQMTLLQRLKDARQIKESADSSAVEALA